MLFASTCGAVLICIWDRQFKTRPLLDKMDKALHSGLRARDFRRRSGLTLEQLAGEAGVSTGHLSRFERGEKALSVAALIRLARALDTTVGVLLGEETATDDIHVVRAGSRTVRRLADKSGTYDFVALSGTDTQGRHEVFLVTLPQSARRVSSAYHAGRELMYLLSGKLRLRIGTTEIELGKGDYVEFPGHYRHEIESSETEAHVLVVVTDAR